MESTKNLFAIILLFGLVVSALGCPAVDNNNQLKTRLAELEQAVNGNKQDQIKDKLTDIETKIATEIQGQQIGMEIIKQQLSEANAKNQRIDGQLQAELAKNMQMQIDYARRQGDGGGMVPDIVWQFCLSVILVVFTVVTVKALLSYFRGNSSNTIVCLTTSDSDQIIKIISQKPEAIKLLENISSNKEGA